MDTLVFQQLVRASRQVGQGTPILRTLRSKLVKLACEERNAPIVRRQINGMLDLCELNFGWTFC